MAAAGLSVQVADQVLEVSESGYRPTGRRAAIKTWHNRQRRRSQVGTFTDHALSMYLPGVEENLIDLVGERFRELEADRSGPVTVRSRTPVRASSSYTAMPIR